MDEKLKKTACDLYKQKYGKLPHEDGLTVLVYDQGARGFYYSTSKKRIKAFVAKQKLHQKMMMDYLLLLTATGIALIIVLIFMLYQNPELCGLITKIWAFAGLLSSVILLIYVSIKKDRKTVFIAYP